MKLIFAVFKPFKLDEVREALTEIGITGMTVTEVKGFGPEAMALIERYGNHDEHSSNSNTQFSYSSGLIDIATETIRNAANTGKIGDGKIFVMPLEEVVRIRTGETGEGAL